MSSSAPRSTPRSRAGMASSKSRCWMTTSCGCWMPKELMSGNLLIAPAAASVSWSGAPFSEQPCARCPLVSSLQCFGALWPFSGGYSSKTGRPSSKSCTRRWYASSPVSCWHSLFTGNHGDPSSTPLWPTSAATGVANCLGENAWQSVDLAELWRLGSSSTFTSTSTTALASGICTTWCTTCCCPSQSQAGSLMQSWRGPAKCSGLCRTAGIIPLPIWSRACAVLLARFPKQVTTIRLGRMCRIGFAPSATTSGSWTKS
mmetsp:Transcript_54773/g.122525  ORF Transcript_54773/g.122525 Transcript_54773/m.122525 type:complete len:259 (+) Transcript_54773:938-1714(+)